MNTPDPRVFFAAERTLLAWVRTGLTVMALGFVVARFNLFLAVMAASSSSPAAAHVQGTRWPPSVLGILLVLFGAATILGALGNHRAYVRSLPAADRPDIPMPWLTSILSVCVALLGFLLAGYLAFA